MSNDLNDRELMFAKWAARFNTRTVVVSEVLKEKLTNSLDIDSSRLLTIQNALDESRLHKPTNDSLRKFRNKYCLSENEIVVASIGHLREVKGYFYLVKAINNLRRRFPNIRLFIAGRDSEEPEIVLKRDLLEVANDDFITFLGEYFDIPVLFGVSQIYVCSSLREGFSLATIEAMASGVPVIATDCGGPSDIIKHGYNGLLVPVADPRAMSDAIAMILQDNGLAERLKHAAQIDVKDRYSLKDFVLRHEQLYFDLARSR